MSKQSYGTAFRIVSAHSTSQNAMFRPSTLASGLAAWIALPAAASRAAYCWGVPFQKPPLGSFQICQWSILPWYRLHRRLGEGAVGLDALRGQRIVKRRGVSQIAEQDQSVGPARLHQIIVGFPVVGPRLLLDLSPGEVLPAPLDAGLLHQTQPGLQVRAPGRSAVLIPNGEVGRRSPAKRCGGRSIRKLPDAVGAGGWPASRSNRQSYCDKPCLLEYVRQIVPSGLSPASLRASLRSMTSNADHVIAGAATWQSTTARFLVRS